MRKRMKRMRMKKSQKKHTSKSCADFYDKIIFLSDI
jgi:hypothetical protein